MCDNCENCTECTKSSDCQTQKEIAEHEAELQLASDDSTIFVLAGCMVDVVVKSGLGDRAGFTRTMMSARQVLRRDPSFIKRFRQQQKAVLDEVERLKNEEQGQQQ